jgi:hypothetical protein
MAEKSGTFKIWLVGMAKPGSFDYDCYGEGTMYAIGMKLKTMFQTICNHKNSAFASADYTWEPGSIAPTDVVFMSAAQKNAEASLKAKAELRFTTARRAELIPTRGE